MRIESDALFLALRNVMTANAWKPKKLADNIIKGPGALKIENLGDDELDYKQLKSFLERKEIKWSETGMGFFLGKVGSSMKKVKKKKTRIDVEKFVKAFDTVVTPPFQVS